MVATAEKSKIAIFKDAVVELNSIDKDIADELKNENYKVAARLVKKRAEVINTIQELKMELENSAEQGSARNLLEKFKLLSNKRNVLEKLSQLRDQIEAELNAAREESSTSEGAPNIKPKSGPKPAVDNPMCRAFGDWTLGNNVLQSVLEKYQNNTIDKSA